jgi:hypothetical protein
VAVRPDIEAHDVIEEALQQSGAATDQEQLPPVDLVLHELIRYEAPHPRSSPACEAQAYRCADGNR